MIDLHTHTLLSDGELIPTELVRRVEVLGYRAIALTGDRTHFGFREAASLAVQVAQVFNLWP